MRDDHETVDCRDGCNMGELEKRHRRTLEFSYYHYYEHYYLTHEALRKRQVDTVEFLVKKEGLQAGRDEDRQL